MTPSQRVTNAIDASRRLAAAELISRVTPNPLGRTGSPPDRTALLATLTDTLVTPAPLLITANVTQPDDLTH